MAAASRPLPRLLRAALGLGAALGLLALTALGARFWLTTGSGRAFLASLVDGHRIGPLGAIRIAGLKGDPLSAASLADITLVDEDGIWLRARDVVVRWRPAELLSGQLQVDALEARSIDVLRRPHVPPNPDDKGGLQIDVRVETARLREVRLAEGVLGPQASFAIAAAGARSRSGAGFGRLSIKPLSGPGDNAEAHGEWSSNGALDGAVIASGPKNGALAALLLAPKGVAVAFNGKLAGAVTRFAGEAHLTFDGAPIVDVAVERKADAAHLSAQLAESPWVMLAPIVDLAGGSVALVGEAKLADVAKLPLQLAATAPAGRVDLHASIDGRTLKTIGPVGLRVEDYDLSRIAPPFKGRLSADGDALISAADAWTWRGKASVASLRFAQGVAALGSGPLELTRKGAVIAWQAPTTEISGGRIDALPKLAAAAYTLASRGEVNLKTNVISLDQAALKGAPGDISGRGSYHLQSGALELSGAANLENLSPLGPWTGSARGQWTLLQSTGRAPFRLSVKATGRHLRSAEPALQDLVGDAPELAFAGVVNAGRLTVESGSLSGGGIEAQVTGRISDAGEISGRAAGRVRRAVRWGAAALEAGTFSASLAGTIDRPRIDAAFSNSAVNVGGARIGNLAGTASGELGASMGGAFSLSGVFEGQTLSAAGRLTGVADVYRLTDASARLGGLKLSPQVTADHGHLTGTVRISGAVTGVAGLQDGTLNGEAHVDLKPGAFAWSASGQAQKLRRPDLSIEVADLTASGEGDQARLTAHARGAAGATFDLGLAGAARRTGGAWTGEASLTGALDALPVAMSRPAIWSWGDAAWSLRGEVNALNGRIAAEIAADDAQASARITLVDMALLSLTRLAHLAPLTGAISGTTSFSNLNGVATGDVALHVANANPAGVIADPVAATFKGALRDRRFTGALEGSGQGFRLKAEGGLPVAVGPNFAIAPLRDGAVAASLNASGRAEQVWALMGPQGQSLRGKIDADVQLAGTFAAPTLRGQATLAEGAYDHGESGLRLRNISARGVFDDASMHLSALSADDGSGGRLTGVGDLSWREALAGSLRFSATDLRALAREDRYAIVSGEGAITLEAKAVALTGDLRITQARFSIEQPASASVPQLSKVRRVNFSKPQTTPVQPEETGRPVRLDLKVSAPRRVMIFGRGLDAEWSTALHVTGPIADPAIDGSASLLRGTLTLVGQRFDLDAGTIRFDGPISAARMDVSATRTTTDVDARIRVAGSPLQPAFTLESTPALPQDEILARVIFGQSATQLSALETARLAAGLAELAGGGAVFDPTAPLRQATGLDRVSFGADQIGATVSAGKYVAHDVYLEVGAGGAGGLGAQVEWEPKPGVSITSGAQANGDTRIGVRWKKDY